MDDPGRHLHRHRGAGGGAPRRAAGRAGRARGPAQRRPRVRPAAVRPGHRGRVLHHRGAPVRLRRRRPDPVAGVSEPVQGTVEDVTLRVTRIRSVSGEVITTPNGQIIQVTNMSRDWARAVIDVPVPAAVDVSRVTEVLRRVGEEAWTKTAAQDDARPADRDGRGDGSRSTRSRCAWWRGRCPASSSRSGATSGPGSRPPSFTRASTSRPSSTPAGRPEAPHEAPAEHAAPYLDDRAGRRVPGRARAVLPGATGTCSGGSD